MKSILVLILLTVVAPGLLMAAPIEFQRDSNNQTYFFRFSEDGSNDEVHLLSEDKKSWRLLVQGQISRVYLPGVAAIAELPERVKLLDEHYKDAVHVVLDGRHAVLIAANGPRPGQGRYLLPDGDLSAVESSNGLEYKNEFYRVFSYRTKLGPKTMIVRRSDGKYRLLATKKISLDPAPSFDRGVIKIPTLSKEFNLADFENGQVSNFENLRKIQLESEELRRDLRESIFGQDSAINALVKSYRELKTNTSNKPRVLLAMGPSGTGKSFTAETFAELKANGLVKTIKGNEFNSHAGSLDYMKLLGGSKGTTAEKTGELIDWLKTIQGKSGVLIIDEGDKMHPEIWLKIMEFLNTGILTDSEGKELRAANLTIFITTNRGVKRMYPSNS